MEKFFWNPTRADRIGVCMGIFQPDNIARDDVEKLVDGFPGQSIDFFGALRARIYDDKVHEFIIEHGIENLGKQLVNRVGGKVQMEKPLITVETLMSYGNALVQEHEKRVQLADSYLKGSELAGMTGSSMPNA